MSWANIDNITAGVINMLHANMELKSGENLLVMTDIPRQIDWEFENPLRLEEMLERNILARLVTMVARANFPENKIDFFPFTTLGGNGVEPNQDLAARMLEADVILAITNYSLSHTNARSAATAAGVRVASMPGFEAFMLEPNGPIAVDVQKIAEDCQAFASCLTHASEAYLSTDYGTELTFSLEGRSGMIEDGLFASSPGKWGNLPAGEVYAVPLEGTGFGKLVVPAGWYERLSEELIFYIEDGEVIRILGGGSIGDWLRQMFSIESDDLLYKARRNLAELGIGANPNARRPENSLEAEKIKGTVHIAFGDNIHMGGKVEADFHEDFVQPEPNLYLDGSPVILKGKWKI